MRDGEIIKEIAEKQNKSLVKVSKELGYSSPSGLYARLDSHSAKQGMTTTIMTKILAAFDSELIVRDKDGNEWKIGE